MTLIADLFPKLCIPENVARYMSKKSRFKGPFDTQHGKRVQTQLQYKDSLLNRDNLTQPIRTPLSQKQKAFSEFFLPFSKSTLNFEHFQKKDDPHS